MLWTYDEAIANDLSRSIDPSSEATSMVRVIEPEAFIGIVAEMQEDKVQFPLICLVRHRETPIDTARANFTAMHKGVPSVYDSETNTIYMEKCIPVDLRYTLYVMTTNTIDMDEIAKEIMFKYSSMYFLTMQLPYESKRKIRFGICLDPSSSIERESAALEYISSGTLYQTKFELVCHGAVMLSYTPRHMERFQYDETIVKNPGENL